MKVIVYAICKNEEKFVNRWFNSMKEADDIYVLDTGSIDNTVDKLKELGVHVKQKIIEPFRFDAARNESLDMVPNDVDICVCTDLDEVFNPGWRIELENIFKDNTRIGYNYNWLLKDNKPLVNFYIEKIHTRNNYKWTHPVHEVLEYIGNDEEKKIYTDNITLNHYPDSSKSRSNYLELLELSINECPDDDRNMHYLGREYMYNQRWNDAIDTLLKHLNLKSATWKDERCASMRFISRCYIKLNRPIEAKMWLNYAIIEAPYLRDPYIEMALLCYMESNWDEVEKYCELALKINSHKKIYINEIFSWDGTVYDLLSLSMFNQERYDEALLYVNKALEYDCNNERLLKNKELINNKLVNK